MRISNSFNFPQASPEAKLTKPKFNILDDLLDLSGAPSLEVGLRDRDTFDGKLFVRWFVHTLVEDDYLKVMVSKGVMTDNDFRFMAKTVAGMLLKAQVMKPCSPEQDQVLLFIIER